MPSEIASDDDWALRQDAGELAASFARVGAFALDAAARDAALVVELAAGAYTVQMHSGDNTVGRGMVEIDVVPE